MERGGVGLGGVGGGRGRQGSKEYEGWVGVGVKGQSLGRGGGGEAGGRDGSDMERSTPTTRQTTQSPAAAGSREANDALKEKTKR